MLWNPMVGSNDIITLLTISNEYKSRPSEIMCIEDEYTAYCFDEACFYILHMIREGKKPKFRKEKNVKVHYSSFSQLYEDYKK